MISMLFHGFPFFSCVPLRSRFSSAFHFVFFFPPFFSLIPIFCDVFFVETRIFFDVLHVFSGIVLVL